MAAVRMSTCHALARSELPNDTVSLARYLLGKVLVRELPEGRASGRGPAVDMPVPPADDGLWAS